MRVPLKYKLLVLLLVLPVVTLGVYLFMAKDVFEKDKISYVFGMGQDSVASLSDKISNDLNLWKTQLRMIGLGLKTEDRSFNPMAKAFFEDSSVIGSVYFFSKSNDQVITELGSMKKENFPTLENWPGDWKKVIEELEPGQSHLVMIDFDLGLWGFMTKAKGPDGSEQIVISYIKSMSLKESFEGQGSFATYLLDNEGHLLIGPSKEKSKSSSVIDKIFREIVSKSLPRGTFSSVFTKNGNEFETLVSHSIVAKSNLKVISLLEKEDAMLAVKTLMSKSILFLIGVVAFSLFVSVMASTHLTSGLRELYLASNQVKEGHYDVVIKDKQNDELGDLAVSFEDMAAHIKKLLAELKAYSENLEIMVAERTRDLNEALSLQKAMVDGLGQGFFIFGRSGEVLPVYSKASEGLYGINPAGQEFSKLIGLNEKEQLGFRSFAETLVDEKLPFEILVQAAPDHFINKEGRHIQLEYHPMKTTESAKTTGVVVVSTDKTEELAAISMAEERRKFADMVVKISGQKERFISFLKETNHIIQGMKSYTEKLNDGEVTIEDLKPLMRGMHTLKGGFAMYSVWPVQKLTHMYESYLSTSGHTRGQIISLILEVEAEIENFLEENKKIIGQKSLSNIVEIREIPVQSLLDFYFFWPSNDVRQLFYDEFLSRSLYDLLAPYETETIELAKMQDKKLAPFTWQGCSIRVWAPYYSDFMASLVHIFRNIVSHALEIPDQREMRGREGEGHIQVSANIDQGQSSNPVIVLSIVDDGIGINADKIRQKIKEKNPEFDDQETNDEEIIQHIFDGDMSTKESVDELSGRGVGLCAVKESVEKVGGSVKVTSIQGEGAIFTLRIPLHKLSA